MTLPPFLDNYFFRCVAPHRVLHSFPTRRSSDLGLWRPHERTEDDSALGKNSGSRFVPRSGNHLCLRFPPEERPPRRHRARSEEHTSELQSRRDLVCRLLLEKKTRSTTFCMRTTS